jgi:hypothetical protein
VRGRSVCKINQTAPRHLLKTLLPNAPEILRFTSGGEQLRCAAAIAEQIFVTLQKLGEPARSHQLTPPTPQYVNLNARLVVRGVKYSAICCAGVNPGAPKGHAHNRADSDDYETISLGRIQQSVTHLIAWAFEVWAPTQQRKVSLEGVVNPLNAVTGGIG